MKILLDISFLGTAYCGYQVQPNAPTVQGELTRAAKELFGFDCDIVGCSRTDGGVHANQFFAAINKRGSEGIDFSIPLEKIPSAFDFYLPSDITVNSAVLVENSFHPRYDVKHKEYIYKIWNGRGRNPFLQGRSWHYPRKIDDGALKSMNIAAQGFVGTYDFSTYMAANSSVKSTVRTVYSASVERDGDLITFHICGDGFLYNMVRIMTGTLIYVCEGKISPEDIIDITNSKDRSRAGITAPAEGLYLNNVTY